MQPLTAVQSEYSRFFREPERTVIPTLEELGIGFVPFRPLGKDFLTGKMTADTKFDRTDFRGTLPKFSPENMQNNYALVKIVTDFAEQKQVTPAQVALAWLLAKKPRIVPIPGTTKLNRLEENLRVTSVALSAAEVQELDTASAKIQLKGERYSPVHRQLVGR